MSHLTTLHYVMCETPLFMVYVLGTHRGATRQAFPAKMSCSFQKRTTSRFVVSKSGQAILVECLRGTGGRCPPDPLGFFALQLETAGACQPDQAGAGPLFTEVWWR